MRERLRLAARSELEGYGKPVSLHQEIGTPRSSREAFERGAWWLAARTSLHHDWYVEAGDLTTQQWKLLAQAAKWAKAHEKVFRFGRMIGGDPRKGEVYGFAAFDAGAGTLALRNPSGQAAPVSKADWPTCWTCPRRSAAAPINCAASSERPGCWPGGGRPPIRCGSTRLLSP